MNTMTNRSGASAGVVRGLTGAATATDKNGNVRILANGARVYADEVIEAKAGATVHIELAGGGFATLGGGDSLALSHGVLADAAIAEAEAAKAGAREIQMAPAEETDIVPLQGVIEAGADPSVLTGPAACCAPESGSTAQEGSHFVIVGQAAARGDVTPGFATIAATGGINESRHLAMDEGMFYRIGNQAGEPGDTQDPGTPAVDGRFVMYMDGDALDAGAASYEMSGKAQGALHTADAAQPVISGNGYGTAAIVNGKVVYTMSDAAREQLAGQGTLVDYVSYTDTDGRHHTIEVVLTTDGHYESPVSVESETHYSVDATDGLHAASGSGNDVHDYQAFFNGTLDAGAGDDTVSLTGSESGLGVVLGNSTLVTGTGDDTVIVTGMDGVELVGVKNSTVNLGDGSNTLDITVATTGDKAWGMHESTVTAGDGNQDISITINSAANGHGMVASELNLGQGQHTLNVDVTSNGTYAYGIHSSTVHAAGDADISVSAKGAYVNAVQNTHIQVDGTGTVNIEAAGFGQVHGLYATTDKSSTISKTDGTAADLDVNITASNTTGYNSPDAIAAYAGDVSINITGEVNAWALAGSSGAASKAWTYNYNDAKYDRDANITIKAGTVNLFAGYDTSGNTTRKIEAATGIATSVSSSLGHDASQTIAAHQADGSGSITVKAHGAGNATMATTGVSAAGGSGRVVGTATNTLTADDHITIKATSEGNSIRLSGNAGFSYGAIGLSATTAKADTGAMNMLSAAQVNIYAGLSEYKGTSSSIRNINEASAAAVYAKGAAPGSALNRITAEAVSIRAEVTSEKNHAIYSQKAYGLASAGYGSNQIILTGTGTSTIGAYTSSTAGHDGLNQQMVYAMHAAGAGAENIIHGGMPGEMAGGTVVLEAMADSTSSQAWGMYADSGGSNEIAAAAVQIHTDGDYQYGMAASGGSNTIITDDFTHTVAGDPAIDHGWSMHATQGGANHLGTDQDSTADAHYVLEGGLYADSGSMNTIITGGGDDTVLIYDHVIGEKATDSAYDYTNWISTGEGSDTVVFFSYTSGVGVDLGAGDDHLVLYGGSDNLVNASFNGGEGWDIIHISGDYSLAAMTGEGGNGMIFSGFEAIEMGGNATGDILTIDSILSGFGSLAGTDGFAESDGAGLIEQLSSADASVLFVNGDGAGDTLGVGDLVDFGGTGGWNALEGTVSHGGSDYVVYHHTGTNDFVAIEEGVSVIGF